MTDDRATPALLLSCWHRSHYRDICPDGGTARCTYSGRLSIQLALGGCSAFARVPGSDDSLAPPAGFSMVSLNPERREGIAVVLAREWV